MSVPPASGAAPRRVPFRDGFPDVVIQLPAGSPVRFSEHPDYAAAKAGDPEAAARFVNVMVTPAKLDELRTLIGDRQPVAVAAHAEEAAGRNAIPQLYADYLGATLGLPVDNAIVQANRPQRTGKDGEYRLSVHSEFDGPVEAGRDYLMIDDNVTQGGTLADLRSYIEHRGGNVIGATTLTGSRSSEILAPRAATLDALRVKFPDLEATWKEAFGYDFTGLTHGEATYLLRSDPAHALGARVIARAQARGERPGAGGTGEDRGGESGTPGAGGGRVVPPKSPGDRGDPIAPAAPTGGGARGTP